MSINQLTLSELNQQIQATLDDAFAAMVWVKAEISELNVNRNGHCYMELVDVDPETKEILARSRATIWSYTFRMLKPYFETTTGQLFTQGIKVLVSAKVEFHPVYGLSLNIRDIDPAYTMGDMERKRREIILQLEEDGVLGMNKELELPMVPQRIAVISSPTAAGLQDFLEQLGTNPQGIRFYTKLFPAVMQGKETASSIIQALDHVFQYEDFFDVVVIIRGGGAQLDLAGFDHYELAAHVAQFPIPVITGIGHDKDETVIDLVAHTKMKTPTAVAEFLINGAEVFVDHLQDIELSLVELVRGQLDTNQDYLQDLAIQFKQDVRDLVKEEIHRFDYSEMQLKNIVPSFLKNENDRFKKYSYILQKDGMEGIKEKKYRLERMGDDILYKAKSFLQHQTDVLGKHERELEMKLGEGFRSQNSKLKMLEEKVRLMDPLRILKRGYSITYKEGKLLKTIDDLQEGDELITRLSTGEVKSTVKK